MEWLLFNFNFSYTNCVNDKDWEIITALAPTGGVTKHL